MAKKTKPTKQAAETRPKHEFQPGNRWRFKPGQCGNPDGRGFERHKESWRDFLNEIDDPRVAKTRLRRLMELAYRKACQGSFKHLELCVDRGFGKPTAHIESVNISGNLADMISEARKRVADGLKQQKQLPPAEIIETAQDAPETAPEATRPAERFISTEPADDQPRNIMEALNRPTRGPRQINVEPSLGKWWRQ